MLPDVVCHGCHDQRGLLLCTAVSFPDSLNVAVSPRPSGRLRAYSGSKDLGAHLLLMLQDTALRTKGFGANV